LATCLPQSRRKTRTIPVQLNPVRTMCLQKTPPTSRQGINNIFKLQDVINSTESGTVIACQCAGLHEEHHGRTIMKTPWVFKAEARRALLYGLMILFAALTPPFILLVNRLM
jgi:hypothetical protein